MQENLIVEELNAIIFRCWTNSQRSHAMQQAAGSLHFMVTAITYQKYINMYLTFVWIVTSIHL